MHTLRYTLLSLMCLAVYAPAGVGAAEEVDIPARFTAWQIHYDVSDDGSFTETQRWSTLILKESAVESYKTASFDFSTSIAKGTVLEAATVKKSGTRLDAPRGNFQYTANNGYEGGAPSFTDFSSISVVFPDLDAGDTTHFAYQITNSEAIFPGHFSIAHRFSEYQAYDDVRITITAPAKMKLRSESYFLTALAPQVSGGRQRLEWSFANKAPKKWTPAERGLSVIGDAPSLYVSTFTSYRQIAEAYGARALPKAAVTPRVAAIAAAVTKGLPTPREQARALYEWVSKNITYGGNLIGVGAVVPRDLNVILDNKMGDCKDHATLLQALLAAKGIESDQALINTGDMYHLPKVPVVSAVNHAITYIPNLDLFLDSTATRVPFGMLPTYLGEKTVLLAAKHQEGKKTPSTAQYGHSQLMRTHLWIDIAGGATGTTHIEVRGDPAVSARENFRQYRRDQEENVVRRLLSSQGYHGTGRLTLEDAAPIRDAYAYSASYTLEDLVVMASTTGMRITPLLASYAPISRYVSGVYEPRSKKAQLCKGGTSIEEYVYEYPAAITLVGYPRDFTFSSEAFEYRARYEKAGNRLTVRRELIDKTSSNYCPAAFTNKALDDARVLLRDLRSQVLIKN